MVVTKPVCCKCGEPIDLVHQSYQRFHDGEHDEYWHMQKCPISTAAVLGSLRRFLKQRPE